VTALPSPCGRRQDLAGAGLGDIRAQRLAQRKVPLVRREMHRIQIDCGEHVEACLLKPERHPSRAAEELD
jgi:hypothetical protein